MSVDPNTLRHSPQLAALELLAEAAETAIVALCAAHPALEHELGDDPQPAIEQLADQVIDQAFHALDALDRYRHLLRILPHEPVFDFDTDDIPF